jgi:hypothetical protein
MLELRLRPDDAHAQHEHDREREHARIGSRAAALRRAHAP